MAAPMEKTRHTGIYKRGSRYVATVHVPGVGTRKKAFRNITTAKRWRTLRKAEIAEGGYQDASRKRFREYAEEWVERYRGKRRPIREATRDDYRRDLRRYAYPYFDEQLGRRLTEIQPADVSGWIGWLGDEQAQGERLKRERVGNGPERILRGRAKARIPGVYRELDAGGAPTARTARTHRPGERLPAIPEGHRDSSGEWINAHGWRLEQPLLRLSDGTVRRIASAFRACMGTAVRERLIRQSPATDIGLPFRDDEEAEGDEQRRIQPFTREQLRALLLLAPVEHRDFFTLLAATGLRVSEAIALRWEDLVLDGSQPHVRVRRRRTKGNTGPPKSKTSKRDVPIEQSLVERLRRRRSTLGGEDGDLAFANRTGGYLSDNNLRRRVLKPMLEEADASWRGAGFHTFRHTCASMLFARGKNVVEVQRWLGHSSPTVTLNTYVHLMERDQLPAPLALDDELGVGRKVGRDPSGTDGYRPSPASAEKPQFSAL